MKQYFYSDGLAKQGPFSLEELKEQKISRNTMVWHHPMEKWRPAEEFPELQEMFVLEPPKPPIAARTEERNTGAGFSYGRRPPRSWLVESILVTLFCCMPFGIAGIVNAARVESRFSAGDLEGAQRSSDEAGKWTKIGFWLAVAGAVIYGVFMVIAVAFNL